MTLDEFLAALRETPRDWQCTPAGGIRRSQEMGVLICPITEIDGRKLDAMHWKQASRRLGLSAGLATCIVVASDSAAGELRSQILDACELVEGGKVERDNE